MSEKMFKTVIADKSAIRRGLLEQALKQSSIFEIVASVSNGRKVVDYVRDHIVDLVITEVDMPEMNGLETAEVLKKEFGVPVVIFSSDKSKKDEAIARGAMLFEPKPDLSSNFKASFEAFVGHICQKMQNYSPLKRNLDSVSDPVFSDFKILCLGASTGGPSAIQTLLSGLGTSFPLPVLYAQHLDVGSDKKMAEWFSVSCPNIPFHLAEEGMVAKNGHVYMAPADVHLVIDYVNSLGNPVLHLSDEPPERFLRPAVNKLFRSAASHYKNACLAVLMTGMGQDGAEGCKVIVDNGGYTIAEDESTCAVFGMPKAAIEMGAAKEILPRPLIAQRLLKLCKGK